MSGRLTTDFDLLCPFAEKDECKALGGRWSPERKKWYVPSGIPLERFTKWLPKSNVITPTIKRSRAQDETSDDSDYNQGTDADYESFEEWRGTYVEQNKRLYPPGSCWMELETGYCDDRRTCTYKHRNQRARVFEPPEDYDPIAIAWDRACDRSERVDDRRRDDEEEEEEDE